MSDANSLIFLHLTHQFCRLKCKLRSVTVKELAIELCIRDVQCQFIKESIECEPISKLKQTKCFPSEHIFRQFCYKFAYFIVSITSIVLSVECENLLCKLLPTIISHAANQNAKKSNKMLALSNQKSVPKLVHRCSCCIAPSIQLVAWCVVSG